MSMIERFFEAITDRLPARFINDGSVPYLERYYLFTLFGWRFYLHRFTGSDPDRGLHDHPWPRAFSVILSGWYWEERRDGRHKVRWLNSLTGDTFHRVVLPVHYTTEREYPCWTLFFHRAKRTKTWGFWREQGHIVTGAATFFEYEYQREGSQKDWWLTAPKGRQVKVFR